MFLQIDKTALFQIIVNIVTILCCGADICVVCRLISVHYFRLSYNCKYCEIVTIFYCVQIEKSAHGKILSCEATNGGEADTSQKVSRNYRLLAPPFTWIIGAVCGTSRNFTVSEEYLYLLLA